MWEVFNLKGNPLDLFWGPGGMQLLIFVCVLLHTAPVS